MPSTRVSLFPSTFAGTVVGEIEKFTRQRRLLGERGTLSCRVSSGLTTTRPSVPVGPVATTVIGRGWSGR